MLDFKAKMHQIQCEIDAVAPPPGRYAPALDVGQPPYCVSIVV